MLFSGLDCAYVLWTGGVVFSLGWNLLKSGSGGNSFKLRAESLVCR
jgi:hypothetical protein